MAAGNENISTFGLVRQNTECEASFVVKYDFPPFFGRTVVGHINLSVAYICRYLRWKILIFLSLYRPLVHFNIFSANIKCGPIPKLNKKVIKRPLEFLACTRSLK